MLSGVPPAFGMQGEIMEIIFLGTGGGRIATMTQMRATGGWILRMDGQMIHVDPGPGALVRAKEGGVDLKKLTGILVSHSHPDHYTDAEVVLESMTHGTSKHRGVVIGNENVIKGGGGYRKAFSDFHLKLPQRVETMEPDDRTKIGKINVEAVPTKHGEGKALGFVFRGSETLGYTGDGEYFPGQEDRFRDCDYLMLNVLRPRNRDWPDHMNSRMAAELITKVRPKIAVLQHFGITMLKAGPRREGSWVEKQTGVKTIVARDGMRLLLEKGKHVIRK